MIIIAFYNIGVLKKQQEEKRQIEQKKLDLAQFYECEKLLNSSACRTTLKCIDSLDSRTKSMPATSYIKAIALFCVGEFDEAKAGFEYFIANTPENDAIKQNAKEYIAKIAQAKRLIRHDVGDYFVELDDVAIWKNPRSLKVYIADDYNKKQLLYDAFKSWDENLHDMVNFYYTNDISEANITAKAVKREALSDSRRLGLTASKYIYYKNRPHLRYMHKADISVAVNFDKDILIEDEMFYSIALHEIGHALGIFSHSPSIGDAMYPSTGTYAKARVSNRDINTVKRLYGNI